MISIDYRNNTAHCETSFNEIQNLPPTFTKGIVIGSSILMVPTTIFNAFNVYALVVTKQLGNPSLRLIFYLSLTDTCMGLIGQPLDIIVFSRANQQPRKCLFNMASECFLLFLGHMSAYIIALIGFDRYFRIKYLNRYSSIIKTWKIQLAIAICLFLAIAEALIHGLGPQLGIFQKVSAFESLSNILIFVLVLMPYILSIFKMKQHSRNASNRYLLASVDKVVTSTATCIIFAVIIMYLPYVGFCVCRFFILRRNRQPWFLMGSYCSYLILFTNSLVNALIFLSYNVKCREVLYARGRRISRLGRSSTGERPMEMRISHTSGSAST